MILWVSNTGEGFPIAQRMKKEGVDCRVYVHAPTYKSNYQGIMPRLTLKEMKDLSKTAELIVFDSNKPNEKTKEDVAFLKTFGVRSGSPSVFGPVADKLKNVIGCSSYTEEVELDRKKGTELARKLGFKIPKTYEMKTLREGVAFLKMNKGRWVFKPNDNKETDLTYVEQFEGELINKMQNEYPRRIDNKTDHILQEYMDGVTLSTEGWFDGKKFVHFNHTIEDKRLMNSEKGPAIGSQNNTVWASGSDNSVTAILRRAETHLGEAGYVGPIDVNCVITEDGDVYFLEFSTRFGWDALYCLLTLLKGKISDFFLNGFGSGFYDGFAASSRISIPPYPYNDRTLLKELAKDVSIDGVNNKLWMQDVYFNGGYKCAGSDGIIGVVAEKGNSIGGAWGGVYRETEKLKIGGYVQYRTDGPRRAEQRYLKLKKWGIDIE